MYVCLLIISSLIAATAYGQNIDLKEVRQDFKFAHKDEEMCKKHHDYLSKKAKSTVEKGYLAAYHMFMARHTSNPFKKLSYFKEGKNMLEKQIESDPDDVELRFIRLCIQFYIPDYLGYNDDVEDDKTYLKHNLYKLQDKEAKDLIFKYLKGAKMYSDADLALLGR